MTVETFVVVSLHSCKDDPSKKFIRAHFCADRARGIYLTAFNPAGVENIEWVKRVNTRGTHAGEERTESRYPVRVTFTPPTVQGSDVIDEGKCALAERPFEGKAMAPASAAALAAVQGAKPRAVTAPAPAPAPTAPAPTAAGDAESIG